MDQAFLEGGVHAHIICEVGSQRDRFKAELAAMRKYVEEYRNVMDDMIQCDGEAGGLWLDAHCSFANEKAIELDAFLEKLATDAGDGRQPRGA